MADLVRLALAFRLLALPLTLLALPGAPWLVLGVVVAAAWSYALLRSWGRIGGWVERHPSVLALDLTLALTILLFAGTDSPFFAYTLGVALLAGVLYGWAGTIVFGGILAAGFLGVVELREGVMGAVAVNETLPALYPLAAAAGVAVRRLLERQTEMEGALAAAGERARLARELHDSVAKTLEGIALLALAVERAPQRAADLAVAARTARDEARALMGDLRADRLDRPLHEAVREHVAAWGAAHAVAVRVRAEPVPGLSAGARAELFCILREALRNVERHALGACTCVEVLLHTDAEGAVDLAVADDGPGFALPADPRAFELGGHFGLLGMRERAARAGGALAVITAPGSGVAVTARVPVRARRAPACAYSADSQSAKDGEAQPVPEPAAAAPSGSPP